MTVFIAVERKGHQCHVLHPTRSLPKVACFSFFCLDFLSTESVVQILTPTEVWTLVPTSPWWNYYQPHFFAPDKPFSITAVFTFITKYLYRNCLLYHILSPSSFSLMPHQKDTERPNFRRLPKSMNWWLSGQCLVTVCTNRIWTNTAWATRSYGQSLITLALNLLGKAVLG